MSSNPVQSIWSEILFPIWV